MIDFLTNQLRWPSLSRPLSPLSYIIHPIILSFVDSFILFSCFYSIYSSVIKHRSSIKICVDIVAQFVRRGGGGRCNNITLPCSSANGLLCARAQSKRPPESHFLLHSPVCVLFIDGQFSLFFSCWISCRRHRVRPVRALVRRAPR